MGILVLHKRSTFSNRAARKALRRHLSNPNSKETRDQATKRTWSTMGMQKSDFYCRLIPLAAALRTDWRESRPGETWLSLTLLLLQPHPVVVFPPPALVLLHSEVGKYHPAHHHSCFQTLPPPPPWRPLALNVLSSDYPHYRAVIQHPSPP